MWKYEQASGALMDATGKEIARGYSGAGPAKNRPEMQHVHNQGPIPQGIYTIGSPRNTHEHGPYVLPLTPDSMNEMFGRTEFLVHGDSILHPGTASLGCMIQNFTTRTKMWESGDHGLQVVSGLPAAMDLRDVTT